MMLGPAEDLTEKEMEQLHITADQVDRTDSIWLDLLPHDVCTRIAALVSKGYQSSSVLGLAEASHRQKQAVLSTLSHTYTMDYGRSETRSRWARVFMGEVRHIKTRESDAKKRRPLYEGNDIDDIFKSASLQTADILGFPRIFTALEVASSLRTLVICLMPTTPKNALVKAITLTNASDVGLICSSCVDKCLFEPLQDDLKRLSPYISALRVECNCEPSAIWEMLPALRNLVEVGFRSDPPERAIPILRALPSVKIIYAPNGFEIATRLGSAVSELWESTDITAAQVSGLAACTRLSFLRCRLEQGADEGFLQGDVVLPDLRSIEISWDCLPMWMVDEYIAGRVFRDVLHAATPGAMERLIGATTNLSKLYLTGVKIRLGELISMLKHTGLNLQEFLTSLCGQDEPEWVRLSALLEAAAMYNRNLRTFLISEGDCYGLEEKLDAEGMDRSVLASEGERLRDKMKRLQRRAPQFSGCDLETFIDSMILVAECEGSMQGSLDFDLEDAESEFDEAWGDDGFFVEDELDELEDYDSDEMEEDEDDELDDSDTDD